MNLAERRGLRLFTLCALFYAQGIPWGFMAITLPAYLAKGGLSEAALGTVYAMSYWPFVFKFLGGPLIDTFTIPRLGRRRPWIIGAQGMMAVTIGGLLLVRDVQADYGLLVVVILTHTVFNALQNVAVDALAIDLLDPDERGRANGFMYGSKYAGGLVGGLGMGFVLGHWGFNAAVVIQIVVLSAILVLPLIVRERAGHAPERPEPKQVARALGRVFRLRSPILAAVMMLVQSIASGVLAAVAPVLFMKHLGWTPQAYSELTGGPGLLVGFIGSMTAGAIADKVGHRRLAALASVVLAAGWLTFALGQAWWMDHRFIWGLAIIEPLAQSMMIVASWSVCMSVSLKQTAATQFAAYTSLTSGSIIIGSQLLVGPATTWWTYQGIYAVAAVFQIATIALLPFIDPEQVRRELPAG